MSTQRLSSVLVLKLSAGRWLQLVRLFGSRRFRRNLNTCGLSPREFLRSVSHSVRYLRRCERRPDPYPVVVVDGFLDARMMALVCWGFPGSEDMEDMPVERTRNAMARRNRKLFRLNPESLAGLPVDRAAFWAVFSAFIDLLSQEMMHALPDPDPDLRVESFRSGFKVRKDLWMDRGGFQISPHTDGVQKYATFLLYCSGHPSLEQEGTFVFVPKKTAFEVGTVNSTNLMILMRLSGRHTVKILCSASARRITHFMGNIPAKPLWRPGRPSRSPCSPGDCSRSEAGAQPRPLGPCPTAPA